MLRHVGGFNTQPPEGGWVRSTSGKAAAAWFQHTATRRRLELQRAFFVKQRRAWFQHTATRRRLDIMVFATFQQ